MVATSHMWLLTTWNVVDLYWDVLLSVKYTFYFEDSVWKKRTCMHMCSIASNSLRPYGLQPARLLSMQEYWSGLPCLPPGDLLDPGIEPVSPELQADSLPLSHRGSPKKNIKYVINNFYVNYILKWQYFGYIKILGYSTYFGYVEKINFIFLTFLNMNIKKFKIRYVIHIHYFISTGQAGLLLIPLVEGSVSQKLGRQALSWWSSG